MSSGLRTAPAVMDRENDADQTSEVALQLTHVNLYYGAVRAVKDITLDIKARAITSIIGPSGCGKSTLLRTLNRINDRVSGFRAEGTIKFGDLDICDPACDIVDLRRRIGMVFQRPNPFPQSIFDNVAFGPLLYERLPKKRWPTSSSSACGAPLCGMRSKTSFTIVIVTHNLQQAARVADQTIFMSMNPETRAGFVVEAGPTDQLFRAPKDQRTKDYITGRFG